MSSSKNWLRLPFMYRPRAERRASPALTAVHWDGQTPRQDCVANISSSGAYVLTQQKWKPGELVSLTLQRSGALEGSNRRRVTVQARAVRRDEDGVALSFLLPRGSEVCLWGNAFNPGASQTQPEDVVREFRLAGALAFIGRISPQALERARRLLRCGLSSHRLEAAIEIALHAEELIALGSVRSGVRVDAGVVIRILEDGSWAEVDWIQHYWSGLLASSCTDEPGSAPDFECPKLMSQLTTMQARIFASACDLASKSVDGNGELFARRLTRSAEDLAQISGTHDRVHIERDVIHLAELGLLQPLVTWKFFALIEQAEVTPTALGLKLYARCHGHSGIPAVFFRNELKQDAYCAAD
ncbi:MAG TPA: PilZ domain-containing protein [Terracidiphilus sp.]